MKAELKFEFDPKDYDEVSYIDTIKNGPKYKLILWELNEFLRRKLKYEDLDETKSSCYAEIREELNNLLQEDNLEI